MSRTSELLARLLQNRALARYAEHYPRTLARIEPTLEAALRTPELDLPMLTLDLARR